MRRLIGMALSVLVLVAALSVVSGFVSGSARTGSPYASALSTFDVTAAQAAHCNDSWCGITHVSCTVARQMSCKVQGGVCTQTSC